MYSLLFALLLTLSSKLSIVHARASHLVGVPELQTTRCGQQLTRRVASLPAGNGIKVVVRVSQTQIKFPMRSCGGSSRDKEMAVRAPLALTSSFSVSSSLLLEEEDGEERIIARRVLYRTPGNDERQQVCRPRETVPPSRRWTRRRRAHGFGREGRPSSSARKSALDRPPSIGARASNCRSAR